MRSARDVCGLLSETIHDVRTGRVDPRIANTVGYLASVLVRALEVGELEERLAALEGAVRAGCLVSASSFHHDLPGGDRPTEEAP
ncbi:MAG TPA: hypothetical protein VHN77_03545 [Phycisphaerales bacterium]|nr:hypothetical protein [Phycisphaerales bacterium]